MAEPDLIVNNSQEMERLGAAIAQQLEPPVVLQLIGDLGAGKTTLARGIARGLGVEAAITSPTFQVHKEYSAGSQRTLHHFDFYRLDDPGLIRSELSELLQDPQAIILIEWGSVINDLVPHAKRITIHKLEGERRRLRFSSSRG